jgi:hypothetical protein
MSISTTTIGLSQIGSISSIVNRINNSSITRKSLLNLVKGFEDLDDKYKEDTSVCLDFRRRFSALMDNVSERLPIDEMIAIARIRADKALGQIKTDTSGLATYGIIMDIDQ